LYYYWTFTNKTKTNVETAIIATSLVFLLLGVFLVSFLIFHKRKQKANKKEKEKLQSQFQQELLRTQLEIQEQTLKNISQEIHDNIGQVLSLAKLNLNRMDPSRPTDLEEKIRDSKN